MGPRKVPKKSAGKKPLTATSSGGQEEVVDIDNDIVVFKAPDSYSFEMEIEDTVMPDVMYHWVNPHQQGQAEPGNCSLSQRCL